MGKIREGVRREKRTIETAIFQSDHEQMKCAKIMWPKKVCTVRTVKFLVFKR